MTDNMLARKSDIFYLRDIMLPCKPNVCNLTDIMLSCKPHICLMSTLLSRSDSQKSCSSLILFNLK